MSSSVPRTEADIREIERKKQQRAEFIERHNEIVEEKMNKALKIAAQLAADQFGQIDPLIPTLIACRLCDDIITK